MRSLAAAASSPSGSGARAEFDSANTTSSVALAGVDCQRGGVSPGTGQPAPLLMRLGAVNIAGSLLGAGLLL